MTERPRIVVDCETTGLDPHHQVTEVAWLNVGTGEQGQFVPPHTLDGASEDALRLSRYWERIATQPVDYGPEIRRFHQAVGGNGTSTALVCCNPSFDVSKIEAMLIRNNLSPHPFHHRKFDVENLAWALMPNTFDELPGLKAICDVLDVPLAHHHEAMADVIATAACLERLLRIRAELAPVLRH